MANDGIFTQPGDEGLFGRGYPAQDPSAPAIDSDGTNLRETLMIAYPSPGHMRVARAIRHPKSGAVEFQEEYREPTPREREWLRQRGIPEIGPGSMVPNGTMSQAIGDTAIATPTGQPPEQGTPWLKLGLAFAAGALAIWGAPKAIEKAKEMMGSSGKKRRRVEEDDMEDDMEDGED